MARRFQQATARAAQLSYAIAQRIVMAIVGAVASSPLLAIVAVVLVIAAIITTILSWFITTEPARQESVAASCQTVDGVPPEANEWVSIAAASSGLPPQYIAALMDIESSFRPTVFSMDINGGTWGLLQLNREEWRKFYPPAAREPMNVPVPVDINNPRIHAEYAGKYLSARLETVKKLKQRRPLLQFNQLTDLQALAVAHNAGEGNLVKYPTLPDVTHRYLQKLDRWMGAVRGECDAAPAASTKLLTTALSYVGVPYVWATSDPAVGFDCSGFVQYVFAQYGIRLPRIANDQGHVGQLIFAGPGTEAPWELMQPGDLITFTRGNSPGTAYHIGIYLGNKQMVHASSSRARVIVDPLNASRTRDYWRVVRVATLSQQQS